MQIVYNIDSISQSSDALRVKGWVLHKEKVEISIETGDGKIISADIFRSSRPDLENIIRGVDCDDSGFIAVVHEPGMANQDYFLVFKSFDGNSIRKIKLETKEKQGVMSNFGRAGRIKRKINSGMAYFSKHGFTATVKRLLKGTVNSEIAYARWIARHKVTAEQLQEQREKQKEFSVRPKISVVIPLYNTELRFLDDLLESIIGQSYTNWELCLADGSTENKVQEHIESKYADLLQASAERESVIVYQRLAVNDGISGNTNAGLEMATGDFVLFSDHDDFLEKDAFYWIVEKLNANPELDLIYTDEDLVDEKGTKFSSPRFKPDFNMDFLCSINYICHIVAVRKTLLDQVGGLRKEVDGAQDWDFLLRCADATRPEKIAHIPRILYHWRAYGGSTAGNPDSKNYAIEAGKRAVSDHFQRIGLEAEIRYTGIFILFQPVLKVIGNPKVSIIIPSYEHPDVLKTCVDSILRNSTYQNYEIIIVENNSKKAETFRYYEQLEAQHSNIRVVKYESCEGFNYSKVNNYGASFATGDYYVLLNNDTEIRTPDWMDQMIGYCQRESTGIVGVKLYYDDNTVQHCGVVVGVGGFAGHIQTGYYQDDAGYFGRLKAVQECSAVTAACLMIKRSTFEAVGGLDEAFTVALNDIDLCLKVRELGQLVVIDPAVELTHYESKSRGMENTPEKHARFKHEIRMFREKWSGILEEGDPYYNPNLTLMYGDCRIREDGEHFDIIDEIEHDIEVERRQARG